MTMTLHEPGPMKRILVGVAIAVLGAIILGLGSAVLESRSDVTALKVRVDAVEETQRETKAILETNRKENREEHQTINDKLDALLTRDAK